MEDVIKQDMFLAAASGQCDLIFNYWNIMQPNGKTNKENFGIIKTFVEGCQPLDICTENVKLIYTFNPFPSGGLILDLPNIDDDLNCRGVPVPPPLVPPVCHFRVTCAEEKFLCVMGNPTITINVVGQLIVEYDVGGNKAYYYISIPLVDNVTLDSNDTFFSTIPGPPRTVTGQSFKDAMKFIDGSCLVVQVNCEVIENGTKVRLTGNVVEKLWKHENIWVTGVIPYNENITIDEEFETHRIAPCT